MALSDGPDIALYHRNDQTRHWPGPKLIPAQAISTGPSINDACPFSERKPTHFAQISGKTIGFCNAFCRDKTVADPGAWPEIAPYLAIA